MYPMPTVDTMPTLRERRNQTQTVRSLLVMSPPRRRLVATGLAADELGIDRSTLVRWWQKGYIRPAFVTAGRHARWDVDDLRRQIYDWRTGGALDEDE